MLSLANLDFSPALKSEADSHEQKKESEKAETSQNDIIKKLTA